MHAYIHTRTTEQQSAQQQQHRGDTTQNTSWFHFDFITFWYTTEYPAPESKQHSTHRVRKESHIKTLFKLIGRPECSSTYSHNCKHTLALALYYTYVYVPLEQVYTVRISQHNTHSKVQTTPPHMQWYDHRYSRPFCTVTVLLLMVFVLYITLSQSYDAIIYIVCCILYLCCLGIYVYFLYIFIMATTHTLRKRRVVLKECLLYWRVILDGEAPHTFK